VKSRFLVFAIPEEEAMEEELPREDTLADIPPLLTAFSSVSDFVWVNPSKSFDDYSF
jgi:hypothetical protein